MFVQVTHDVANFDTWQKLASDWQGPPSDFRLHSSVTAKDHSKIFCLWEVESVSALSEYLDQLTSGVLKNTYYAIDDKAPATMLPHAAVPH